MQSMSAAATHTHPRRSCVYTSLKAAVQSSLVPGMKGPARLTGLLRSPALAPATTASSDLLSNALCLCCSCALKENGEEAWGSCLQHPREAHALALCGAASVEGAPCVRPPVVCTDTCRDRMAQGTAARAGKLPGARA